MPSEAEIAWAAGLFEGEGTIHIGKREKTYFQMHVTSTDHDVLLRFAEIVKVGRVRSTKRYHHTNVKPLWTWSAGGPDAAFLLIDFLPWLGSRRTEKAMEALSRYETKEEIAA